MGKKRKREIDVADSPGTAKRKRTCSEEYGSDESLRLPDIIFGEDHISSSRKENKKKKHVRLSGNDHGSPEAMMHSVYENGQEHCDTKLNSESTSNEQFELYLVRKPVEISLEQLSDSRIPFRSCFSKEKSVAIGDKCFIAHGSKATTQMFHIPADIIHSSQNPWFTGIDNRIKGSVLLSRAELYNSTATSKEDGSTAGLSNDLPFKVIRKKVSRKRIRNLKQRLRANGVKIH